MDNPDEELAVNVWQWNINGIGHSSNGINGFYESAFTMDGRFNTSYIGANSITVNHLSSDVGRSLDLSSNESINLIVSDINDSLMTYVNSIADDIYTDTAQSKDSIDTQIEELKQLAKDLNASYTILADGSIKLQQDVSNIEATSSALLQKYERLNATVNTNEVKLEDILGYIKTGLDENGDTTVELYNSKTNADGESIESSLVLKNNEIVMRVDEDELLRIKDSKIFTESVYIENEIGLGYHTIVKLDLNDDNVSLNDGMTVMIWNGEESI